MRTPAAEALDEVADAVGGARSGLHHLHDRVGSHVPADGGVEGDALEVWVDGDVQGAQEHLVGGQCDVDVLHDLGVDAVHVGDALHVFADHPFRDLHGFLSVGAAGRTGTGMTRWVGGGAVRSTDAVKGLPSSRQTNCMTWRPAAAARMRPPVVAQTPDW
ncbi:hypothetical protein GA0115255_122259 [Streptomyces sp. Ncost-T6T-2b]|nr:hypothetical protein GA0115255_122259 [Streptomyces sp. Ncost-T6T-2b]